MLVGLIFLFAPQSLTNRFQFTFARIFRWPLSIGRNIPLLVRADKPPQDATGRREARYQNYIAYLEEQLRQKQQTVEALSGLRSRFHALEGAKLVPADVITRSSTGLNNELLINRGSDDGLAADMFVMGDNSVIGTICDVAARTGRVKLFTDVSLVTQVRVGKLQVDMLMQGAGNNSARIRLIPVKHRVNPGDFVFAKARPGFLDGPMIVGTVEQCRRDDDNPSLWDITVRPVCDMERLSSVAVVVMNP